MSDREEDQPVNRNGPIANPVDRFMHLPEPVRRWLERLSEDDLKTLLRFVRLPEHVKRLLENLTEDDVSDIRSVVRSLRKADNIWWFIKVLLGGMFAIFTTVVLFGETWIKAGNLLERLFQ